MRINEADVVCCLTRSMSLYRDFGGCEMLKSIVILHYIPLALVCQTMLEMWAGIGIMMFVHATAIFLAKIRNTPITDGMD
jgi:hypothetical protein